MAITDKLNYSKITVNSRNYKDGIVKVVNVPIKRPLTVEEAKEIREDLIKREVLEPEDMSRGVATGDPVKGCFYLS